MKVQTQYDKIDWDGLMMEVRERYAYLRIAWKATQKQNQELHEKMVEDLYMPALGHLAAFCASIKVDEEKSA